MVIDFSKMEEQNFPGFKGGEGSYNARMHTDELGKIMLGRLEPDSSIGLHTHETNSEIIYIISGKADLIYDDGTEVIEAGGCHYCPMGHTHSLMNKGDCDLVFFAVVPEQNFEY